jgi:hypothetical protein
VAFTQDRYGHLYENREPEIQDRLDALLEARQVSKARNGNVVDISRELSGTPVAGLGGMTDGRAAFWLNGKEILSVGLQMVYRRAVSMR